MNIVVENATHNGAVVELGDTMRMAGSILGIKVYHITAVDRDVARLHGICADGMYADEGLLRLIDSIMRYIEDRFGLGATGNVADMVAILRKCVDECQGCIAAVTDKMLYHTGRADFSRAKDTIATIQAQCIELEDLVPLLERAELALFLTVMWRRGHPVRFTEADQ